MALAYRQSLHSFLRTWLRQIGAPTGVHLGFPSLKKIQPREIVVPEVQFEQTMRAAPAWLQLALLLAHDAGLRHQAIHRFSRANCDFEREVIRGVTKAEEHYEVPMTKRLRERLLFTCAQACDAREPLLAVLAPNRRAYNYHTLNTALARTKKAAGVTQEWGFHDLRRTAARRVYENTRDIGKVQRFLSHRSPGTTWWYLGNAGKELTNEDVEAGTIAAERKQA